MLPLFFVSSLQTLDLFLLVILGLSILINNESTRYCFEETSYLKVSRSAKRVAIVSDNTYAQGGVQAEPGGVGGDLLQGAGPGRVLEEPEGGELLEFRTAGQQMFRQGCIKVLINPRPPVRVEVYQVC